MQLPWPGFEPVTPWKGIQVLIHWASSPWQNIHLCSPFFPYCFFSSYSLKIWYFVTKSGQLDLLYFSGGQFRIWTISALTPPIHWTQVNSHQTELRKRLPTSCETALHSSNTVSPVDHIQLQNIISGWIKIYINAYSLKTWFLKFKFKVSTYNTLCCLVALLCYRIHSCFYTLMQQLQKYLFESLNSKGSK